MSNTKTFETLDAAAANKAWLRALDAVAAAGADPLRTLPAIIGEAAARYGDAPALISDSQTLSFRELAARISRYADWALATGVAPGEVVGLLAPNGPDYFAIWLGIASVGGVVALLNVNLTGAALAHCLDVASVRRAIVAPELAAAYESAAPLLAAPPELWLSGAGKPDARRLDLWRGAGNAAARASRRARQDERALCIYTSGTTGMPKAANVSHRRLVAWSVWFAALGEFGPDDRLYNCLPMYHSVGGVVAVASPLLNGGSVAIAEKFSAARFWRDVARFDCTAFQYIGELCRYLLSAPETGAPPPRRLRLACGNGMSADVWNAFQARFRIPRILEFYAATESNFSLFNVEGKPGAIGRIPGFMRLRDPVALIRVGGDDNAPERGADGFCMRCRPGEPGEAIGRLSSAQNDASARFEGYTSAADSEKKILRDVFKPGDRWMRSGDLMRMDAEGYFHFLDRLGDTFRWKGENVATAEVAAVLAACPGVAEAMVYGVKAPGAEGRAGMALLRADGALDLAVLAERLAALPAYARPIFLRLADNFETTATFKHRKAQRAAEGYDPAAIADALFVFDRQTQAYAPLDAKTFNAIQSGAMRL